MAISNLSMASSAPIIASLTRLKTGFNANSAWLPSTNSYLVDTIDKLKQGFLGRGPIVPGELIDYLASSIGIHCYNSWSYLGAAVGSYLEGDFPNAIHNAYYAELRSIMAFLASQGVGVFNSQNVIVDNLGAIHKANCTNREDPTHKFAKAALDQWLQSPTNSSRLLDLISVEDVSLKTWCDSTSFPPDSNLPGLQAASWFKDWSLDMTQLKSDGDFRNFVSYQPQTFDYNFSRRSDDVKFRVRFIQSLWQLCSPKRLFDLFTLRSTLESLYFQLFGLPYNKLSELNVETELKPVFTNVGKNADDARSEYVIKFLRKDVNPDLNPLFSFAKLPFSNPILESDTEPVGILSRACLLALLVTKIVESTYRRATIHKVDLKSWYDNIGLRFGYWTSATEPYLYSDLWSDIDLDLEDLNNWLGNNAVSHSNFSLKRELGRALNVKHLAKPYLWSVAI